jgi:hypothetical protein
MPTPQTTAARLAALAAAIVMLATPATAGDTRYGERYDRAPATEDLPWRGSTKDEDGYPEPLPPPPAGHEAPLPPPRADYAPRYERAPRYDDRAPPRRTAACADKHGIRNALKEQGWHRFDDVRVERDVATMTADDDRGRRHIVEFDTCTGDVVDARPLVAYADPPPPYPRRHWRDRYYGDGYGPPRPRVGIHIEGGWRR